MSVGNAGNMKYVPAILVLIDPLWWFCTQKCDGRALIHDWGADPSPLLACAMRSALTAVRGGERSHFLGNERQDGDERRSGLHQDGRQDLR